MLSNQKGFGLIEMMITLVITAVGILATMSVVKMQTQANLSGKAQAGASNLGTDVRLQLARRNTCLPSFVAAPTSWTGDQNVSLRIGTHNIAVGPIPTYDLKINSLRLSNWTSMGVTSAGRNLHASDLILGASSLKWGSQSSEEFSLNDRKLARVIFEINPDNSVFSCYGVDPETDLSNLLELACTSVGGTFASATNTCTPKPSTGGSDCATREPTWHKNGFFDPGTLQFQDRVKSGEYCINQNEGLELSYGSVPAEERSSYKWVCPATNAWGADYGFVETRTPSRPECKTAGKLVVPAANGNRIPAGTICYKSNSWGGIEEAGRCLGGFYQPKVIDSGGAGGPVNEGRGEGGTGNDSGAGGGASGGGSDE